MAFRQVSRPLKHKCLHFGYLFPARCLPQELPLESSRLSVDVVLINVGLEDGRLAGLELLSEIQASYQKNASRHAL
jgi:hypothetical protein